MKSRIIGGACGAAGVLQHLNPVLSALAQRLERNDPSLTTMSTKHLPLWELTFDQVEYLLQSMTKSSNVNHVEVELCPLPEQQEQCYRALSNYFASPVSSLHTLTVSSWTTAGFHALCRALPEAKDKLKHLIFGDCRIDMMMDDDGEHVGRSVLDGELLTNALLKTPQIRELTLQGFSLDPDVVIQLSQGPLHNLHTLQLHQIETDPGSWGILLGSGARKLVISSCDLGLGWECSGMPISDHPLYLLMAKNSLEHLEISSCGLGNYEVEIITRSALVRGRTSLLVLDLSDNGITEGVYLGQLLQCSRKLRYANLSDNPLPGYAWNDLSIGMSHHPNLEELYIRSTGMAAVKQSITNTLAKSILSLPRLWLLDLSDHAWGSQPDAAAELLTIAKSKSLKNLVLQGCQFDDNSLLHLLQVARSGSPGRLKRLDWSLNPVRSATPALTKAIQTSSLLHLDLSSCGVSDEVLTALSPAFCASTITSVALGMNRIGNLGCQALGEQLQNHPRGPLRKIDLSLNPLDADGLQHLVQALKTNVSLTEVAMLHPRSFVWTTPMNEPAASESSSSSDASWLSGTPAPVQQQLQPPPQLQPPQQQQQQQSIIHTNPHQRLWESVTRDLHHYLRWNRAGRGLWLEPPEAPVLLPNALEQAQEGYGKNGLFSMLQRHAVWLSKSA